LVPLPSPSAEDENRSVCQNVFVFEVLANDCLIPVTVRSTVWVCEPSINGIVGSNSAENMGVRVLFVCCVGRTSTTNRIAGCKVVPSGMFV